MKHTKDIEMIHYCTEMKDVEKGFVIHVSNPFLVFKLRLPCLQSRFKI